MAIYDTPPTSSQFTYETEVLVAGGGPVGMLMSYQLARSGISCMMVEQGTRTTAHPKMEFLNPRSMEIFRRMGLESRLRAIAVPEKHGFNEIFSTGLSRKDGNLVVLERESAAEFREKWREENDGTHAQVPYMRISQIIVEAWLKPVCAAEPLIDDRWGWTFQSLVEKDDHVLSTITDGWGKEVVVKSKFVVGCDGAGSKVRLSANLEAKRKPMPLTMYMVHFRTNDLETMYSQGQFWHLNFLTGSIVINQDEKEIFTFHTIVPTDTKAEDLDPMKVLTEGLGGIGQPCPIKVEKILKTAVWKSSLSVADAFRSNKGRVFLAGDAAHQLTPVGGNGLNSGIGDTFDLTWKLASVLRGYGGEYLLKSYDHERRPVSKNHVKRVEEGMGFFLPMFGYAAKVGHEVIHSQTEEGEKARNNLKEMIQAARWIHSQEGNWIDTRYKHSPVVVHDPTGTEPQWELTKITPSTWPGVRAPHVYLSDGMTSIFDLYGPDYTIVDFTQYGEVSTLFLAVAKGMGMPIKRVSLPSERHIRSIWQRDAVLVRPDGHVAWCAPAEGVDSLTIGAIKDALAIATGRKLSPDYQILPELQEEMFLDVAPEERIQVKNEQLQEDKTGRIEQLEDALPGISADSIAYINDAHTPNSPSASFSPLESKFAQVSIAEVVTEAGPNSTVEG